MKSNLAGRYRALAIALRRACAGRCTHTGRSKIVLNVAGVSKALSIVDRWLGISDRIAHAVKLLSSV